MNDPDPSQQESNPYAAPEAPIAPVAPGGAAGPLELASRSARLGGALIDGLIMIPVVVVVILLLFGGGYFAGAMTGEVTVGIAMELLSAVLIAAAYIGINYHFWNKNGQSIGKLVAGDQDCPNQRGKVSRLTHHSPSLFVDGRDPANPVHRRSCWSS